MERHRISYDNIDLQEFSKLISSSKENVSSALAVELGLGGLFANELCLLSGVDSKQTATSESQVEKLYVALQNVLKQKSSPILVVKDNKPTEVIVFPMRTFEKFQLAPLKSISKGIDKIFLDTIQQTAKPVKDKQLKKVETIVAMQEKNAVQLEQKSEKEQEIGEFIYENYQNVKEVLEELQILMKHHSLQEIQKKLKGHKTVKEVNPKDGTVILEF